MATVSFNSGIEIFDNEISQIAPVTSLFEELYARGIKKQQTLKAGQPAIQPSNIEVTPFVDSEDQFAYVIMPFCDLPAGRLALPDLVLHHRWEEINGKNVLTMVYDDGSTIISNLGPYTVGLSTIADFYKMGHHFKANGLID